MTAPIVRPAVEGTGFDDILALVVGGASGLGLAIAQRLGDEGAEVVVADLDHIGAQRAADRLGADGIAAHAVPVDVRHSASVAAMFEACDQLEPALGVMVLSAAVETRASLLDCTDEAWDEVLAVNLKGPFLCMQQAVPRMVGAGGGSIVALGSTLGQIVASSYPAYCASKFGLTNLCKQVAIEHAAHGVRVNVVAPSACDTGLFMRMAESSGDPEGVTRMVTGNVPMGRLGSAEEVCDAVVFLASNQSSYMSGAVLPLDGGLAARRT